jgi:outer membrane receptor for Fe3+-dicitrate
MANEYNGDLQERFNNGAASQVTVFNTPLDAPGRVQYDSAFFVQDSWTLSRLTINPGLRIEWLPPAWTRPARRQADSHQTGSTGPARPHQVGTRLRAPLRRRI